MSCAASQWLEASRLWLVLDRQAAAPRSLGDITALCGGGGVDVVLCRIKGEPQEDVRRSAREVRDVASKLALPFVISHQVDLALELAADGVQLGGGDPPVSEVRKRVRPGMVIGYSTHSVPEAIARFSDGADYVFLGPIFPTPAKLRYGPALGLAAVWEGSALPGVVVFIGGINALNALQVVQHGGMRIAAISALQQASDPRQAALELRSLLPD